MAINPGSDILAESLAAANPQAAQAATDRLAGLAPGAPPPSPAPSSDPFQAALADFKDHMAGLSSKYGGGAPGTSAPGASVPGASAPGGAGLGGTQLSPQQMLLMQAMKNQQQPSPLPQQANYGGIPSPNYAAAGGPSNGTANMLQLMMQGRQHTNMLAALLQSNGGGGSIQ